MWRHCTNPKPAYGGKGCSGSSGKGKQCNKCDCDKPEECDGYTGVEPGRASNFTASIAF